MKFKFENYKLNGRGYENKVINEFFNACVRAFLYC
jgi:hypothetical protein